MEWLRVRWRRWKRQLNHIGAAAFTALGKPVVD
jgi:hypothetical protein